MPLPTAKTPAVIDHQRLKALLYGPPKIGKSSFAAQFPGAIFLATEPGLSALEVYQTSIGTWADMLETVRDLEAGKHDFRTVVVDTSDLMFRFCQDAVCAAHKIKHPADMDFGKGYALVNNEFQRVISKLAQLPYGLILISHSQDRTIKTRTGEITKTQPTLPEKARNIVLGIVDAILLVETSGKDRVIRTKPTECYEAGDRTGRLPDTIPLDYQAFAEAFHGPKAKEAKK